MVRQHDAPGLVLMGEDAQQAAPAQASRQQAEEIFQLLAQAQAHRGTHFDQKLFGIVEGLTRRGLVSGCVRLFYRRDCRSASYCAVCTPSDRR